MMALDRGRVNITAVSTGIAQKALDEAAQYANTRVQFGQPIGNFQGVHFMLADMNALTMAGSGYMKGTVVEKLMRDAKLTQIFEGTNQINRMVAGRGVLAKTCKLF